MLGFLSLGLIWFFWINLVFWFNLGFITLEGVVFPPMIPDSSGSTCMHAWRETWPSLAKATRIQ